MGIAWVVGRGDFNELRLSLLNAGVNVREALDVVVLGVLSLNKVWRMAEIWWFVAELPKAFE